MEIENEIFFPFDINRFPNQLFSNCKRVIPILYNVQQGIEDFDKIHTE